MISGWTEKFQSSQSQTCTKKVVWSLLGGLLLVWTTAADFWIERKPFYWESMLNKSMMHTKKCPQPALVNRKVLIYLSITMPKYVPHNQCLKLLKWSKLGCKAFLHPLYSPDFSLTATSSSISTSLVGGEEWLYNQQKAKNALQKFYESRSMHPVPLFL